MISRDCLLKLKTVNTPTLLFLFQVMKKYDELQYQAVVEGANMKDTSRCPKCQYIAFAEETVSTFHCPQCNFKSCRECGEEAHPGIRCDEVETKNETTGRNKVEEAMSNAVIRKCPRPFCRKPFMKTDGCNKITCRWVHLLVKAFFSEICDAYAFGAPIKVVVPSFATFVVKKYLQRLHMHTCEFALNFSHFLITSKQKNSSFH
jgi:hypothetical protein